MVEEPLIIKIESARGEVLNAIQVIQNKYSFPACVLDGIMSSILSEIRAEEKIELVNANAMIVKNIQALKEEK